MGESGEREGMITRFYRYLGAAFSGLREGFGLVDLMKRHSPAKRRNDLLQGLEISP